MRYFALFAFSVLFAVGVVLAKPEAKHEAVLLTTVACQDTMGTEAVSPFQPFQVAIPCTVDRSKKTASCGVDGTLNGTAETDKDGDTILKLTDPKRGQFGVVILDEKEFVFQIFDANGQGVLCYGPVTTKSPTPSPKVAPKVAPKAPSLDI